MIKHKRLRSCIFNIGSLRNQGPRKIILRPLFSSHSIHNTSRLSQVPQEFLEPQHSDPKQSPSSNPTTGRPATTRRPDRLSFWPFLFIFALGSGGFVLLVRTREGVNPRAPGERTERGELHFKKSSKNWRAEAAAEAEAEAARQATGDSQPADTSSTRK